LKYGLRRAIDRGLQLAIFNSCDGLGLAYEVEQLGLPQMVVMRQPVPDPVAQAFLKDLLTSFVGGQRFYLAVREARERLQRFEQKYPCASWLPVIFQNPTQPPLNWDDLVTNRHTNMSRVPNVSFRSIGSTTQIRETVQVIPNLRNLLRSNFSWKTLRKRMLIATLCSLVMSGLVINARWQGNLQPLELQAYDFLMRHRPVDKHQEDRMLIVHISKEDLEKLKVNQIPDQALLKLLQHLKTYKPRIIGIDVFRPSPTGSINQYTTLINYLKTESNITALCGNEEENNPDQLPVASPKNVTNLGFSDIAYDKPRGQKYVRRHLIQMPIININSCPTEYSLNFQVALQYLQKEGIKDENSTEGYLKLGKSVFRQIHVHAGGYQILDDRSYQFLLNYRPYHSLDDIAPKVEFGKILEAFEEGHGSHYANLIKNKIILIGYSDKSEDSHNTPYGKLPGVFIQAHMISQILTAAKGERSLIWWWPIWGDWLWILSWAMLSGIFVYIIPWRKYFAVSLGALLSLLVLICWLLLVQSGWVPLVPTALAIVLTNLSLVIYQSIATKISQIN
jgi:CHASE2 domain-containing sensor protein